MSHSIFISPHYYFMLREVFIDYVTVQNKVNHAAHRERFGICKKMYVVSLLFFSDISTNLLIVKFVVLLDYPYEQYIIVLLIHWIERIRIYHSVWNKHDRCCCLMKPKEQSPGIASLGTQTMRTCTECLSCICWLQVKVTSRWLIPWWLATSVFFPLL